MRSLLDLYTVARPGWPPPNVITYYTLLIWCCLYVVFRGGAPERLGTALLALGSILTSWFISNGIGRFQSVEVGVLFVDLVCLAAFILLSLRAERFWPLWVAAFQALGTSAHIVKYYDPDVFYRTYAFFLAFWSYPMIALLFIGTWRHRGRVRRLGFDVSWSPRTSL